MNVLGISGSDWRAIITPADPYCHSFFWQLFYQGTQTMQGMSTSCAGCKDAIRKEAMRQGKQPKPQWRWEIHLRRL